MENEDEIWHVLTSGGLYLQRVDDSFEWVDTDKPDYLLTADDAVMINMRLEQHSFSQAYIDKCREESWEDSKDIALMVALCHQVPLDDLELLRLDGDRYPMRLTEDVKRVFYLLYEVLNKELTDILSTVNEMNVEWDGDD